MRNVHSREHMHSVKLCTKNYENPSMFVKVTAKKSVAPFFLDTVYIHRVMCVDKKQTLQEKLS